jgi:Ca2+-binding EF-hand superfamily protein
MKTSEKIGVALSMAMLLPFAAMADDKKMDTNGDGMVSASEHAASAKKMFDAMDANHDGNVTAAEMDAMHQARMKEGKATMSMSSADKIKAKDTNGDGMLSAAENAAGAQRNFDAMDTNHDGNLSAAELKAGHEAMAAKSK